MPNSQGQPRGFVDMLMSATPKWALVTFSVMVGASLAFGIMLSTTGLQAPFNRIVDAYVKRIEQSVDRLENAASDVQATATRLEATERALKDLANTTSAQGKRLDSIDTQLDDHARRIRNLEANSRVRNQ